jgi:hypothetical protein
MTVPTSARLSTHIHQLAPQWADFHSTLHCRLLLECVKEIQIRLQSVKNVGQFTWSTFCCFRRHTFAINLLSSSENVLACYDSWGGTSSAKYFRRVRFLAHCLFHIPRVSPSVSNLSAYIISAPTVGRIIVEVDTGDALLKSILKTQILLKLVKKCPAFHMKTYFVLLYWQRHEELQNLCLPAKRYWLLLWPKNVGVYTVVGNKDGTKTCWLYRRSYIPLSTTIPVLHFLLWISKQVLYNFRLYLLLQCRY